MHSPEQTEDSSTFANSTLQPPPASMDDESTLASEPLESAPISQEDVAPFEIGDADDDEERGPMAENRHSLPSVEELKAEQSPTAGCGKMLAWMFLIFALLIAMTVGLAVGLTNKGTSKSSSQAESGGYLAYRPEVMNSMKAYIISEGVSSESDFLSSTSPQSIALDFLANQDPLRLNTPLTGLDTDEGYSFITRYVMSLCHAALGGDRWNYDLLFNTKHETCEWYDVFEPPVGQVGVLCNHNTKKIVGLSFSKCFFLTFYEPRRDMTPAHTAYSHIVSNNLDGTLPSELGVLSTLTYFESIANNVKGKLPDRMQELTNLKTAVFAFNLLTGSIPSWFGKLSNIQFTFLSNNLLTGSVPSQMKNLQDLTVLAMDDNMFTGSIGFAWEFPKLEYVYLEDNAFYGPLPKSITQTSPRLINLDLSGNVLSGRLPSDLFKLSHLVILDLHNNTFNGALPSNIPTNNKKLEYVAVYQNQLSSTVPTELGLLTTLQHLDLSANEFVGDIPAELANLANLTYLFLAQNSFNDGPIPTFMYTYTKLQELSLKRTQRTGRISELIAELSDLVLLDLDDNALTGPIPSEIGTLKNLEFLLLNSNQLSETVPTQLGALSNIRKFQASHPKRCVISCNAR